MEKVYKYKNGTIYVTFPDDCDRNKLKKVTEEFLKRVIKGGINNVYSNTSRNFREE